MISGRYRIAVGTTRSPNAIPATTSMSSSLERSVASAPRSRLMSMTRNTRIAFGAQRPATAGCSGMSGYSSHAAMVLVVGLRGIGELAWCREIMGCKRGRWCDGMRMVANVLPLGCPLPSVSDERKIRIHPRRLTAPCRPLRVVPKDPLGGIPSGTLYCLSSPLHRRVLHRVHSVTIITLCRYY